MTRRLQSLIAFALALCVLAIFVSPFAASEMSTLRTPHKMRPMAAALPLALYLPLAAWLIASADAAWQTEKQLVLPGSEIVRLTCSRLC